MLDISSVNKTSPEANWNRRTDAQDHVLSQADALTKNLGLGLKIETAKTNFGPCSSLTPLNRFPTLQGTFYVFLCVPPLKIFC